jgi:hypothetical protein
MNAGADTAGGVAQFPLTRLTGTPGWLRNTAKASACLIPDSWTEVEYNAFLPGY